MLLNYIARTRNLLQSPSEVSTQLYSDVNLTLWINQARGQLAGEAECIRVLGTVPTIIGQRLYSFASLALGTSSVTGVQGALNINAILYGIGDGQQWIPTRPWPWFQFYNLNNVVPDSGAPVVWSQYAQGSAAGTSTGSAASGSFYIDPLPDAVYTLNCDCVCYPIDLSADNTPEAIPYLWTDAVPYYAGYLALMSAQTSARIADAERLFNQYNMFVERARKASNPSVLRWQYNQAGDPTQAAKIGLQAGGQ